MKGRIKRPTPEAKQMVLPRVGNIRIGYKDAKGFPRSADYFIPAGKYAALFTKAYGEKPQTIQIVFVEDDAEKVCNERYEYRDDKGALVAYGDGETFGIWNGNEYQEFTTERYPDIMERVAKKTPNALRRAGKSGWRILLTLHFLIPMVQGVAGLWTFTTCGEASTIPNIRDTFDAVLNGRGYVKGVIFDLNVAFAKTQKPDKNSRFPVVTLVPNENTANVEKIKAVWQPIKALNK